MVQAQAKDLPAGRARRDPRRRAAQARRAEALDLWRRPEPDGRRAREAGLWLDAFVPGLPLSYLDHNLKRGNSLVGVVGEEVREALTPERGTLEGNRIDRELERRPSGRGRRSSASSCGSRTSRRPGKRSASAARHSALSTPIYHRWTAESFDLPGRGAGSRSWTRSRRPTTSARPRTGRRGAGVLPLAARASRRSSRRPGAASMSCSPTRRGTS